MINIVLFQPEIPQNTGNIIRLASNSGTTLHLIKPFGFTLNDKNLKRAQLDYEEWADIKIYNSEQDFFDEHYNKKIYALTTKATKFYTEVIYNQNDFLMFGPETRGLPDDTRTKIGTNNWLKIPQQQVSRSLNLSNSVAIVTYEALRQLGFKNLF